MDSYLKELQGTLARTAQKKKTMLSKVDRAKREKHNNRFGARPANPQKCEDLDAAKLFLNEVKIDANQKSRDLVDADFESTGEKAVRQMNEAANRAMREMVRWKRRVVALGGSGAGIIVNEAAEKVYASGQTWFIGAAKLLPEAVKKADVIKQKLTEAKKTQDGDAVSTSDDDDEIDANFELFGSDSKKGLLVNAGAIGGVAPYTDPSQELMQKAAGGNMSHVLSNISPEYLEWSRTDEEDRELRKLEARLELQHRKQMKTVGSGNSDAVGSKRPLEFQTSDLATYIKKLEHIPTDTEIKAHRLAQKKLEMKARLAKAQTAK